MARRRKAAAEAAPRAVSTETSARTAAARRKGAVDGYGSTLSAGTKRGLAVGVLALWVLGVLYMAASDVQKFSEAALAGDDGDGADGSPTAYVWRVRRGDVFGAATEIPRMAWRDEAGFVERIVAHGRPVILTGTPAAQWPAAELWTPDGAYISDWLPAPSVLRQAYNHSSALFGPYWDDARPLSALDGVVQPNKHTFADVPAEDFFAQLVLPAASRATAHGGRWAAHWQFFTANINAIGRRLAMDVQPTRFLELAPDGAAQNMNVWFGPQGATSHTHYDGYENFNVQLHGAKRWMLFPPDSQSALYVYPFVHPAHAQTQVDIDAAAAERGGTGQLDRFPKLREAEAWHGVTRAGDVLYVPTVWFHHVEALEPAVNFNVWSYGAESELMAAAVATPVPHDPDWPLAKTARLVRTLIVQVVDRVRAARGDADTFVREFVVAARYGPLIRAGVLPSPRALDGDWARETCGSVRGERFDTAAAVDGIVAQFERMKAGPRGVYVGNWVEYMAASVNQPALVGAWLMACFVGG